MAFLIVLGIAGCGPDVRSRAGRASDMWVRQYAITADGEVQIVGASGAIVVTASTQESVEVKAERVVLAPTAAMAEPLVSHVRITEDVSASRILLRSDGIPGSMPIDVLVNFDVVVPARRRVRLRAADGPIVVRNVTGKVVASTANGSITLEDVAGEIEARTENGSIDVAIPARDGAEVDAHAMSGIVAIAGLPVVNGAVEPRHRLRERLNGGGRLISLTARAGNISIRTHP